VLIHTTPAAFAEDVGVFASAAEVCAAGAEGAGFAEEGEVCALAGVAVACGLSELLDCAVWAANIEPLANSADEMSRSRHSFFAMRFIELRFVALLLTEMFAHWNAGPLEFRHDGEEKS
jgi:hypothetical protein